MLMTHLPETRAGIQRRKLALDSSASFWRELQQNLRQFSALVSNFGIRPQHYNLN